MNTERITHVIPEHVGYFWEWTGQDWQIRWEPVKGIYSPPSLMNLSVGYLEVPEILNDKMGLVIGKDGSMFKFITHWSYSVYIFYRQDINKIEIWGYQPSIDKAIQLLRLHFMDVMV